MSLNASWKVQSTVHVVIDPQFGFNSSNQKQLILQQLDKWGNTGVANVTFLDKSNGGAGPGSGPGTNPILFISKALPDAPGAQGQEQGISYGGCRGDTEIKINPGVTDPTAFIQVVSHEIGHTFGLQHCNCPQNSTAMTLPASASLNAAGGYDGPTSCDIDKFRICGTLPTPTPTPTPDSCTYQEPEQPTDPSGYGELLCEICFDGQNNDCESGTDLVDYKCSQCTSPIVIDTLGNGFDLTSAEDGVEFDIAGIGRAIQVSWTQGDEAWLTLDRNGNGNIDSGKELFGAVTSQPASTERNGFLALAEYDKPVNGGNADSRITNQDSIFNSLRLWQDTNHNGISEANELFTLPALNIAELELDYHESKRTDEHGNKFRFRAKVWDANKAKVGRWAWDVFLITAP
ncbi:MAG: hypothetical protein WKF71_10610 [Pyrinomonadaceae bacterium]